MTRERFRFSLSLSLSFLCLLPETDLCGPDVRSLVASKSPSGVRGADSSRDRLGVIGDRLTELSGDDTEDSLDKIWSGFGSKVLASICRAALLLRW